MFLDSGDIIVQKDLSVIYFYDIKDNYFGSLEILAGYYLVYKDKFTIYNNHPQESFIWINIRLFRKDEYYRKTIIVINSYLDFQNPSQDNFRDFRRSEICIHSSKF